MYETNIFKSKFKTNGFFITNLNRNLNINLSTIIFAIVNYKKM